MPRHRAGGRSNSNSSIATPFALGEMRLAEAAEAAPRTSAATVPPCPSSAPPRTGGPSGSSPSTSRYHATARSRSVTRHPDVRDAASCRRVDAAAPQRAPELRGRDVVGDHGLADVRWGARSGSRRRGSAGFARSPGAAAPGRAPPAARARSSAARRAAAARASARAVAAQESPRAAASWASTDHPERDRLAVQQLAVARDGLHRVGDRVAEAERAARVLLVRVARDQLGLDRAGAVHERLERVEVAGEDRARRASSIRSQ